MNLLSVQGERTAPTPPLEFGLLGPLVARSGDEVLDIGPPKRRVLLIRLLLERGHAIPLESLCDDLWPGRPPRGAVSSVHAHISRLRDALEPQRARRGKAGVLVREPMGYALRVPPEAQDAVGFERALGRARRLLGEGRVGAARQEIDTALGLWRGAALADAVDHPFAAQEITRLEEARLLGRELRVTILVHEGNLEEAVLSAEELTARNPLREVTWELLMHALYLSGRPAEALQRYAKLRGLLSEELGMDPGPRLRRLQTAILRQDDSRLSVLGAPVPQAPASG
ncbi:winged helix-turn-helix domain-containing protein [Streptomyces sp. LP05-1]|uniref:Winged helix-turn-helix domain-containing protein n=1 Tax=Streptomyces pyxinae TaxID=2970734 RepID=A0ABT2CM91_9ACTN|nr:BTAD domain-containing putative transcriptional regulator [Streptomyces sp. LP05-1]MCS0638376.1 winged helix-turn-helix domain-containing protein [Streptomyces sp. LP05-1]